MSPYSPRRPGNATPAPALPPSDQSVPGLAPPTASRPVSDVTGPASSAGPPSPSPVSERAALSPLWLGSLSSRSSGSMLSSPPCAAQEVVDVDADVVAHPRHAPERVELPPHERRVDTVPRPAEEGRGRS
ncbi:hypothetical protein THAOC_20523 [Thalassiosira oceanica]|uniref:Uncharacterized protein n=1 Tax=Thalassiosira oceanica TaxID=159749 RepID=K0SLD0_THAOC|nr:hypothetical protein THAOC_20523 [Thalassiosira oceanica]|eukprot:EJK59277.1 hypothetical protein THAOC_20523 [Thalassiosira oceanica]